MNGADLLAILPLVVLAGAAVLTMLVIAVRREHALTATSTVIGIVLALASLPVASFHAPRQVTPLFVIDGYALLYIGLVLGAALGVVLLSYAYLRVRADELRDEYYVLVLLAAIGAAAMTASSHFASFFVALETLSIALLAMIAYPRGLEQPIEAGLKYLILSGVSSAFLLFGVALVYAETGSLAFAAIGAPVEQPEALSNVYWLSGVSMILVGVGFKLSVVPFHMWAPDVYEGAPAPVAAFVAVVSKCAVVAVLLRYFLEAEAFASGPITLVLSAAAVLSMIIGNLLALLQDNIKRILAYSSIAHLGYVLVAFLAGGALAIEAVTTYLVAYAVMSLGAFGVVALLSPAGRLRDADDIAEYRGLFRTRPWLAFTFSLMLLSLAGIPLTLGFIAKFYAVTSGVSARLTWPVAALIVGSIIGLYYYLRIIVAMLSAPEGAAAHPAPLSRLGNAVLAILVIVLIGFGVYPAPLVQLIRTTATPAPGASETVVRSTPQDVAPESARSERPHP